MLTIGIIGFGKSANRYHLPYLLNRKNINVKMIFNRSQKPDLEEKYKQVGISFTTQLNDVFTDPDIQLVSICTPPETHFKLARLCLEHGKHVIVEKPFTINVYEAERLFKLAEEKDLFIMPFQNRRFDSDFLALKHVLESDYLGKPVEVESHLDYYRPYKDNSPGKFYQGALYGLGVHLLDQAVSLFGTPERVYYDLRSLLNKHDLEDYYHLELFYPTMKVILKTSHLVKIPYPSFILHGSNGSFVKNETDKQETHIKTGWLPENEGFGLDKEEEYGTAVYVDRNGKDKEVTIPTPPGDYGKIYDNAYDVIIHGSEKLVKNTEVLTVMNIMERGMLGSYPKVINFTETT